MSIFKLDEQGFWIKKRWKFILKLSISLGLICLVLFFVDFRQMWKIIIHVEPRYILAILGLIFIDRALMAYKWSLLLQALGIRVPFFFLFNTYTVSTLFGVLLPSNVGSDLFRTYSLRRYKADTKSVLASIIVERAIAFIMMLILTIFSIGIALYLIKNGWSLFSRTWLTITVVALIVGILLVVFHKVSQRWIDDIAARFSKHSWVAYLHRIYKLVNEYRYHLGMVSFVSVCTLIEQLAPIAGNFFLVRALHIQVSILELVAIIPIIVFAARMPISIEGYGVSEGLFVVLFGMVGVTASEAFTLGILSRTLPLLFVLPWGIHYIMVSRQIVLPKQLIDKIKLQ